MWCNDTNALDASIFDKASIGKRRSEEMGWGQLSPMLCETNACVCVCVCAACTAISGSKSRLPQAQSKGFEHGTPNGIVYRKDGRKQKQMHSIFSLCLLAKVKGGERKKVAE
jgi:hypothetical protein